MAATYLQLKNGVANIFGRSDGATADAVRDNDINTAIRFDIANAYPFTWLRKSSSLSIDSSGQADLPEDFNYSHPIYDLFEAVSGTGNDVHYQELQRDLFDNADNVINPRYYIDWNSSTERWRVNANTTNKTLTCVYQYIPAELSDDADVSVIPDPMAVIYLAAAHVWIGFYFDETNHDRFERLGLQRVAQMIRMDKRGKPQRNKRGSIYTADLGFNQLN